MKQRILVLSLLLLATPLLSKGAQADEIHPDSARASVPVSYDRAYDASLEGIRSIGGLSIDKKSEGWVKTEVDNYSVAVQVKKMPNEMVQIDVSARKPGFPEPQYANVILAGILRRVNNQPLWMH